MNFKYSCCWSRYSSRFYSTFQCMVNIDFLISLVATEGLPRIFATNQFFKLHNYLSFLTRYVQLTSWPPRTVINEPIVWVGFTHQNQFTTYAQCPSCQYYPRFLSALADSGFNVKFEQSNLLAAREFEIDEGAIAIILSRFHHILVRHIFVSCKMISIFDFIPQILVEINVIVDVRVCQIIITKNCGYYIIRFMKMKWSYAIAGEVHFTRNNEF